MNIGENATRLQTRCVQMPKVQHRLCVGRGGGVHKVCRTDICGTADIIMEQFEHTDKTRNMWYPNEMDILSAEDAPTYGGMKDPLGVVES